MPKFFSLAYLLLLTSCALRNQDHKGLKEYALKSEYSKAIELARGKDYYPEERSKLLKYLELGTLHYYNGEFYQALQNFDLAQDLSDKLFTVSLSKKLSSTVVSDALDNYYGEKYERSLIRFYQALVHFKIYEVGFYEEYKVKEKEKDVKIVERKDLSESEKKSHLFGARASILEWDTLLSKYSDEDFGKNVYKMDLALKIFGALIHEQIGTRSELQIARQLYLDAKEVLLKYYSLYPSYNKKYKDFSKDYSKFASMNLNQIEKKYIEQTEEAKKLLAFLDSRLKDLSSGNKDNVKILLQKDFIVEKKTKDLTFKIPVTSLHVSASSTSEASQSIMSPLTFALFCLSLPVGEEPLIHFELPSIEDPKEPKPLLLAITNQKGEEVLKKDLVLLNPLSEIAFDIMDKKVTGTYIRIGTRIALKHAAALIASYGIYKNNPNLIGQGLGLASYVAASKGISQSEKADLRFWSTLPNSLHIQSLNLLPGEYKVNILEEEKTLKSFNLKIEKNKNTVLDLKI